MRRAKEKGEAVRQIVAEMLETAEDGRSTLRSLDRLNDEGYEYARGSNSRKDALREGYEQAKAIIERRAAEKAQSEQQQAEEAGEQDSPAPKLVIDKTPPSAYQREWVIFIPHPKPFAATDAEIDEYVSTCVVAPKGWQVVGIIQTRTNDGEARIRLRLHPTEECETPTGDEAGRAYERRRAERIAEAASEIKSFRDAHGLTQEQLSRLLPVNIRTLQDWESGRGHSKPPEYLARALAHVAQELTDADAPATCEECGDHVKESELEQGRCVSCVHAAASDVWMGEV